MCEVLSTRGGLVRVLHHSFKTFKTQIQSSFFLLITTYFYFFHLHSVSPSLRLPFPPLLTHRSFRAEATSPSCFVRRAGFFTLGFWGFWNGIAGGMPAFALRNLYPECFVPTVQFLDETFNNLVPIK